MHSTDLFCVMSWLFIIIVQMVDSTVQNDFCVNI
jgi:hypothetical protein